jgi:hypothetical protein
MLNRGGVPDLFPLDRRIEKMLSSGSLARKALEVAE